MVWPFTSRSALTSSLSFTSAPMESCQSAPALHWATMPLAALESGEDFALDFQCASLDDAFTMPTRASVRFSWLVNNGTDSGISMPESSTTTGKRQPGRFILPPE